MKIKITSSKIIRWTVTIALFLIVLELCARLDDYLKWKAPIWGEYSEKLLSNTDSLGYRNVPNAKFQKWHINSFGFRGPEITLSKPPGVIRIMVLGASETFGLYESQDKEYPAQMQQILDSEYPGRFQVINAASTAMNMPRINRYYKDWLITFNPDIVILYPPAPLFYLTSPPNPEPARYTAIVRHKTFASRLLPKASIVFWRAVPPWIQINMKKLELYLVPKFHPKSWVLVHPPPDHLAMFQDHLMNLINTIRSSGAILIIGTHASIYGGVPTNDNLRYMLGEPQTGANCRMEMEKEANDIIRHCRAYSSLTIVDIDSLMPKSSRCFADHVHFTDTGSSIVANAFVKAILQVAPKY